MMASSSSSSSSIITPKTKYDVFLSFGGKDTQYGFTSHLYEALCKKKILAFIDTELIRGDEISSNLSSAIEGSKISVIIFSQGYAYSRWCLEELVKILECKNIYGQIVIPVFYNVDPSHVRKQTGAFGDAFAKLEERFKDVSEKVQKWRVALTETANLSGFDSNDIRSEATLVKEIVGCILKILSKVTSPSDNENLVGIEADVQAIEELLKKDVCTLGIWGMGGIGKTTIARAVFNKISSQFEGSYFFENVMEQLENRGPNHLRQQLLHAILEDEYVDIEWPITKKRLGQMKILIVFDDITCAKQIEDLIKDPKILGLGSRIIITTRDKQVLRICDVNHIYEVKRLSHPEDLQLFSQYAFKSNHIPEDYVDLSKEIVYYAKGLPLALKMLGSSLLDKRKQDWKSAINNLQDAPPLDIYKVLKLSYDELDRNEKDIFLDIACFFKGKDLDMVIKILNASGLEAEYGISILVDKSLIAISSDNTIKMDDFLEEMGKTIAREEKNLGKSSLLWHQKDIKDVLEKNVGIEVTRGICLNMFKIGVIHLNPSVFSKLRNLIFLKVYGDSKNKLHGFQGIEYDFKELKYIYWDSYQWKSLPCNFSPKKVVALEMHHSKLEALWLGVQKLDALKYIDLSYSTDLRKIPDLSQAPNLESVILIGCTSLLKITFSSTHENLNKLIMLNLRNCKRLCSLPRSICKLKSLRHLILSGCSNLKKVPKMPSQIEELYLDETAIEEFPSSIEHLSRLVKLSLENCSRLEHLPENICEYISLRHLILTGCSNLKKVPKMPSQIEELYLDETAIEEFPSSIEHLSSMVKLSFKNCSRFESLPGNICENKSLRQLILTGCSNLNKVPKMPRQIEELYLDGTAIKELSSSIEHLSGLVRLSLKGCMMLENLSNRTFELKSLKYLYLSDCSKIKMLPNFSYCQMTELYLDSTAIKELPSLKHMSSLVRLSLNNCCRLESLPEDISELESLLYLYLSNCANVKLVPELPCLIKELDLCGTAIKELSTSSIEHLSNLEKLGLQNCSRLDSLPNGICELKFLKYLYLNGSSILDTLPENLGKLKSLKILNADETAIREIPTSFMCLNVLEHLSLGRCNVQFPTWLTLSSLTYLDLSDTGITEFPSSLWKLSSIESLHLGGNNFESIPVSIINLIHLTVLNVSYCRRLQSLPDLPSSLYELVAHSCTSLQTLSRSSFLSDMSAYFIECSKLDENALKNGVKDVLQHIRENILYGKPTRMQMCFLGSEIPECLNFRSDESFIELPRGLFSQNVVGMVFCTVLAFQDYDHNKTEGPDSIIEWELSLKCEDDNYKKVSGDCFWVWDNLLRPKYIQSDHVFIYYLPSPEFHEISQNGEAIISFHVTDFVKNSKVRKCGVHFFYKEESEEESQECSSCISSLIFDDVMQEEEEPQSKIFEIENFFEGEYGSSNLQVKYDVFLNFREEDTRDNFTSHLHASLCRSKIAAFIDIGNGKFIEQDKKSSHLNAIEESMISIIVFSEGYASSSCCLEELVKILECKKKYGQVVIPVFYQVEQSHVRHQTGIFGNAFSKLEECFKDRMLTWRIALREAAYLSGFDSNAIRCESDLVEEIVKHVLKLLNHTYSSANKELVGLEPSIKKIESLLCTGLKDVCIVGVWGIGGVGKTTIARVVFEEIHSQFEASYFASNVREQCESPGGITFLRQELLFKLLNDRYLDIGVTFIKQRLSRKKVLIVFDDVTSLEQIKLLIGDFNCLGVGSQVIITTRDRQVLKTCGVDDNHMYLVEPLFHREALQLFSWYAFQQNRPIVSYYELSNKVVQYTEGIPLALKVLGSFLLGKTKRVWEIAIDKLKRVPHKDIQMMLNVSYDGLDDDEQNIFLDIACFLKWEDRNFVIKFLDSSGFFAAIGVSVLIERCLITVSNNKITMHDLLQEMGREIVKKESVKDLGRRSRLCYYKDICHVLKSNMGTKAIEGICLDMSKIKAIDLNHRAFEEMHNLRFLKVYNSRFEENDINKVFVPRNFEFVFTELCYLCWHGCPLKSLGLNFQSENLVALDMPKSNIEQFWPADQHLDNLQQINLSHSKHLLKIPDLSVAPNLEILILEGCTSLSEISSSKCLNKLVILNLRQCKSLHSLPMAIRLKSLRKVILSGCSNLKMLSEVSDNIEELFLDETAIKELPPSIGNLSKLVMLNLKDCSYLEKLPSNFCRLKSLEHLTLSGCSKLNGLPDYLRNLEALKMLEVGRFPVREALSSILNLYSLMELNLTGCDIVELPSSLGQLSSLESLLLSRNKFESIPTSIRDLVKLSYLELSYCERLQALPVLPDHLQYLGAQTCTSLEASSGLSILLPAVSRNARVNFIDCFKLDQNALINIVKYVLQIVQDTAMEFCPRPSAYICFPGTEIPEWFTSQHMGSSIKFELPLGGFNPGLVSFAVCAIVEFGNYHDAGQGLVVHCVCKLGSRDGTVVMYYDIGPYPVDSDHIFLGYDLHMCSFDFNESRYKENNEVSIQFYVEDLNSKRIDYCEVKKCGVHLLYYPKIWNLEEVKVHEGPPSKRLKRA